MIYFFNGVFIVLVVMVMAVIARDFKDAKAGEAIPLKRITWLVGIIVALLFASILAEKLLEGQWLH